MCKNYGITILCSQKERKERDRVSSVCKYGKLPNSPIYVGKEKIKVLNYDFMLSFVLRGSKIYIWSHLYSHRETLEGFMRNQKNMGKYGWQDQGDEEHKEKDSYYMTLYASSFLNLWIFAYSKKT